MRTDGSRRPDFFISYAGRDRAWAEWVGWQLEHAPGGGFAVELDVWDWPVGENFVAAMSRALQYSDRVLALLSDAYFDPARYSLDEWTDALVKDDEGHDRLLPVRVELVSLPPMIRTRVLTDLFGVDEGIARKRLLNAVTGPRRPDEKPGFPGGEGVGSEDHDQQPRLPGRLPSAWNVPAANPDFTGRDRLLVELRERFISSSGHAIQVLHGIGGAGKTQIAVEYAHRHASVYDVVWWVSAEQPDVAQKEMADLASRLDVPGAATSDNILDTMERLAPDGRWLLVLDSLSSPHQLARPRTSGRGHILVTSPNPAWHEAASRIEVGTFSRVESVALLRARDSALSEAHADQLAEALGDLPLALAQAGSWLAETGTRVPEYLALLADRKQSLLDRGRVLSYSTSLTASLRLAVERLRDEHPAAAQLLLLVAFLGSDPVPIDVLDKHTATAGGPLADISDDPISFRTAVRCINLHGLARISDGSLQLHRLVQELLQDQVDRREQPPLVETIWRMLGHADPGDPDNPESRRFYAAIVPHLLSTELVAADNPACRCLVMNAVWYLSAHGDHPTSRRIAEHTFRRWQDTLPDDDYHLQWARNQFARAERCLGNFVEARVLDEDALEICRRTLGDDHPDTLVSANNLAVDLSGLGDFDEAYQVDLDTRERRARVLGPDHPHTLGSANNIAVDLSGLGRHEEAYRLCQDTLERCEQALGENHPLTLATAANLAHILSCWGELEAARELGEDTLERRQHIFGKDHPLTLATASNLAHVLSSLGEHQEARKLDEDTLVRRQRVLGEDHPQTLATAADLAADLTSLGFHDEAKRLTETMLHVKATASGRPRPRLRKR